MFIGALKSNMFWEIQKAICMHKAMHISGKSWEVPNLPSPADLSTLHAGNEGQGRVVNCLPEC